MNRALVVVSLVAALGLSACSGQAENRATTSAPSVSVSAGPGSAAGTLPAEVVTMLEGVGVTSADVRGAVEEMDQLDQARPLPVQGSVRTDEVVFSQGGREVTVPIPGEEVYVSVAPYVTRTHDCHFHALGSCQGELAGEDVTITVTDQAGKVLVEQDVTTYTNGFAGFWLPKDTAGTVSATYGDLTGEVPFDTHEGQATCLTGLQLG